MEEAIKVYQNNIHPITSSIEKERLVDLIETHGTEHVQQAIEEAVMHNARNLKYAHKAAQKGGQVGHADRRSDELHKGSARSDIRNTNTADGSRGLKKVLEDI